VRQDADGIEEHLAKGKVSRQTRQNNRGQKNTGTIIGYPFLPSIVLRIVFMILAAGASHFWKESSTEAQVCRAGYVQDESRRKLRMRALGAPQIDSVQGDRDALDVAPADSPHIPFRSALR
jgi:hypothetical protein